MGIVRFSYEGVVLRSPEKGVLLHLRIYGRGFGMYSLYGLGFIG